MDCGLSIVGNSVQPFAQIAVSRLQGFELVPAPEALTDIVDGSLGLTFQPWTVGPAGNGRKPVVSGEVDELMVEAHPAALAPTTCFMLS
jgi:hypothetical protein